MTDEQKLIFDWMDNLPTRVPDWSKGLPEMYESLNSTWFDNALPELSDTFICEFQEMPRENAGIYIDAEKARELSTDNVTVRVGIRINSNLQCLTDHVKIAMLHEMIHARGIKGHEEGFQNVINALFDVRAYRGLL